MPATAEKVTNRKKTQSEADFETVSYWVPRVAIGLSISILVIYFAVFHNGFGGNNEFGTFGDFIGGTLNPLLTFGTVLLLIYSIRFQLEELRETRKEIERSRADIQDSNRLSETRNSMEREIFDVEMVRAELDSADRIMDEILNTFIYRNTVHGPRLFSDAISGREGIKFLFEVSGYKEVLKVCILESINVSKVLIDLSQVIQSKGLKIELIRFKAMRVIRKFLPILNYAVYHSKDKEFIDQASEQSLAVIEACVKHLGALITSFDYVIPISTNPD